MNCGPNLSKWCYQRNLSSFKDLLNRNQWLLRMWPNANKEQLQLQMSRDVINREPRVSFKDGLMGDKVNPLNWDSLKIHYQLYICVVTHDRVCVDHEVAKRFSQTSELQEHFRYGSVPEIRRVVSGWNEIKLSDKINSICSMGVEIKRAANSNQW